MLDQTQQYILDQMGITRWIRRDQKRYQVIYSAQSADRQLLNNILKALNWPLSEVQFTETKPPTNENLITQTAEVVLLFGEDLTPNFNHQNQTRIVLPPLIKLAHDPALKRQAWRLLQRVRCT